MGNDKPAAAGFAGDWTAELVGDADEDEVGVPAGRAPGALLSERGPSFGEGYSRDEGAPLILATNLFLSGACPSAPTDAAEAGSTTSSSGVMGLTGEAVPMAGEFGDEEEDAEAFSADKPIVAREEGLCVPCKPSTPGLAAPLPPPPPVPFNPSPSDVAPPPAARDDGPPAASAFACFPSDLVLLLGDE
jgi:hypothetical protein